LSNHEGRREVHGTDPGARINQLDEFVNPGITSLMATVIVTPAALVQFAELPKAMKPRMLRLTERLERWPDVSGARPLSGKLAGRHRLRTGDYRLQFRIEGAAVVIEKIGHRDRFYDD
jgi:mRNA-degrading endonuclease RelE of RelBE toxin-antitoxin system